jgi:hypothetical protein
MWGYIFVPVSNFLCHDRDGDAVALEKITLHPECLIFHYHNSCENLKQSLNK